MLSGSLRVFTLPYEAGCRALTAGIPFVRLTTPRSVGT